jgi:hypothetical protein
MPKLGGEWILRGQVSKQKNELRCDFGLHIPVAGAPLMDMGKARTRLSHGGFRPRLFRGWTDD